jgi:formylmethanofuran:tetrahydromethanopterin formyltransferase
LSAPIPNIRKSDKMLITAKRSEPIKLNTATATGNESAIVNTPATAGIRAFIR